MEVTRCLTCLALLLSVTSTSAEPQLFGLLRDKLPSVLPTRSTSTTAAPEISSTTPSTTTTTASPAGDSNPAANVQHLQALQALHDIQSIHALQNLQALQNIQNLQNLQTAVERAKRSGNILQLLGGASGSSSSSGSSSGGGATADAPYPASLGSAAPAYGAPAPAPAPAALGGGGGLLGGRGILSAILGSSSSNSATAGVAVDGKGPTYGNYIGMGAGLPMVYGQRSFDFQSFRQSLLGVLMQAVRAITGGVIALKGQLVRVKGQLLSAKGNIISASGEALSQFGRNIASNALRPKPPEPPAPPRPVYGPPPPVYGPPSYMGVLPIPRPVYGPPMYSPPSTISFAAMPARPMYGVPGLSSAPQHPAFNVYSTINTIGHDQPRFQASFPPPARAPSVPTYSSGTLNSYGPPLETSFSGGTPLSSGTSFSGSSSSSGTPFSGGTPLSSGTSFSGSSSSSGTPFSSGTPLSSGATYSSSSSSSGTPFSGGTPLSSGTYSSSGSSSGAPSFSDASQPSFPAGSSISSDTYSSDSPSSHNQPSDSYGPPGEVNSLSYSQSDSDSSFGGPESSGQPSATYYKRNTNQGRDSDLSSLNTLQGAHAGLLLLKPVNNINSDKQQAAPGDEKGQKNPQPNYSDLIQSLTGSGYASPSFGAKIGERGDIQQVNPNERTLSLLFGSKKPKPLRPHPVTRALPPQVIAAASAKLAAQLDFAGRAPPRTAVAVSGPHGKFIMYHK